MVSFLSENKEWLFSGLGIFLITVGFSIVRIGLNHRELRKSGMVSLLGIYSVYQYRIRDDGTFIKSKLEIKKNILGVAVLELDSVRYHYKGRAYEKGHNFFLNFDGLSHEGDMNFVFKVPISSFDVLIGVYSGITSSRLPVSGKVILKREAIDNFRALNSSFEDSENVPEKIRGLLASDSPRLMLANDLAVNVFDEI
ncbi:hypothetical protein [Pseudoalteromonas xiamenensis]